MGYPPGLGRVGNILPATTPPVTCWADWANGPATCWGKRKPGPRSKGAQAKIGKRRQIAAFFRNQIEIN